LRTVMEEPSFGMPTPTKGAPPLGMPVPESLLAMPVAEPRVLGAPEPVDGEFAPLVPGEEEPKLLVPDDPNAEPELEESPPPLVPGEPNAEPEFEDSPPPPGEYPPLPGDPNADVDCGEVVAPAPPAPGETIPAAEPNPVVRPAKGCPKNPFTVVFASPTWMRRQSALPVMGST
jgi:hypothetical protein